jgi:hypothetical protein
MILLISLSMKGGELDEIYMHLQNTNRKGIVDVHILKQNFTCVKIVYLWVGQNGEVTHKLRNVRN